MPPPRSPRVDVAANSMKLERVAALVTFSSTEVASLVPTTTVHQWSEEGPANTNSRKTGPLWECSSLSKTVNSRSCMEPVQNSDSEPDRLSCTPLLTGTENRQAAISSFQSDIEPEPEDGEQEEVVIAQKPTECNRLAEPGENKINDVLLRIDGLLERCLETGEQGLGSESGQLISVKCNAGIHDSSLMLSRQSTSVSSREDTHQCHPVVTGREDSNIDSGASSSSSCSSPSSSSSSDSDSSVSEIDFGEMAIEISVNVLDAPLPFVPLQMQWPLTPIREMSMESPISLPKKTNKTPSKSPQALDQTPEMLSPSAHDATIPMEYEALVKLSAPARDEAIPIARDSSLPESGAPGLQRECLCDLPTIADTDSDIGRLSYLAETDVDLDDFISAHSLDEFLANYEREHSVLSVATERPDRDSPVFELFSWSWCCRRDDQATVEFKLPSVNEKHEVFFTTIVSV